MENKGRNNNELKEKTMSGMEKPKYDFEWQKINNDTERLKVPGGWIVKIESIIWFEGYDYEEVKSKSISTMFVADPEHEWERSNG